MSRLPTPGSDNDIWGDVLNDFLSVGHNPDGTLKLPPSSGNAPDATTTSKGVVQLAGDLSGTAAAPTVPGLASKVDTSRQINTSNSVTGGGDLTANRTLSLVGDAASPGNNQYYGTNGSGTKGFHAIPSSDPSLGGDLTGTASNAQIAAGAIVDADVSGTANIAQSKINNLTTDLASKANDSTVVHKTDYTAKGDILVGTGNGAYAAQGVGSDNDVLVADSSQASGVRWAPPAAQSTDDDIYALHWMEVSG